MDGSRTIPYRRDLHPLQLIKGDGRGNINRCLKNGLTMTELERLRKGGSCGTYLFWKCNHCEFRMK